jgi:hypothetical protein
MVVACTGVTFGQQTREEYLREQEQLKRMLLMKQLDSGVYYMESGQHALADEKFKGVLANIKAVPSDLAYYFGKNSYFLKQYQQSIDWLNKYIQLKGMNGQFSKDAVTWLRRSEQELLSERKQEVARNDQVLSSDYEIDCGPTGKVICPVCRGDHVIIKKGAFGDDYRTCPYCNEHGILSCEEYNLLVKGELKPKF